MCPRLEDCDIVEASGIKIVWIRVEYLSLPPRHRWRFHTEDSSNPAAPVVLVAPTHHAYRSCSIHVDWSVHKYVCIVLIIDAFCTHAPKCPHLHLGDDSILDGVRNIIPQRVLEREGGQIFVSVAVKVATAEGTLVPPIARTMQRHGHARGTLPSVVVTIRLPSPAPPPVRGSTRPVDAVDWILAEPSVLAV